MARMLELGVNRIDTAAAYGPGHSEQVIRSALEGSTSVRGVIAYPPMASGPLSGTMTRERIEQVPDDEVTASGTLTA